MSDPITQKLDEMQALTCSSSVPLGVSVARHADRLLAETRLELRKCIDALKVVMEEHGKSVYWCSTCEEYGQAIPYPCPTVKAVAKALGVDDA